MIAGRIAWIGAARRRLPPADPGLWPIALLGFLARGGWVIVLLPIVALPSPVGLATLVGPDVVGAAGLSARGQELVAAAIGIAGAIVVAALVISAWSEREAYRWSAWSAPGHGAGAPAVDGQAGLAGIVAIAVVALVPLALGLAVAAGRLTDVAIAELEFPTRLDVPFGLRVAERAQDGVAALVVGIVVADLIHAVAVRCYLSRRPLRRALRHPLRLVVAGAVGWGLTLAGCAVAIVVLRTAWAGVVGIAAAEPYATDIAIRLARDGVFALSGLALAGLLGVVGLGLAIVAALRKRVWAWAVDGA